MGRRVRLQDDVIAALAYDQPGPYNDRAVGLISLPHCLFAQFICTGEVAGLGFLARLDDG